MSADHDTPWWRRAIRSGPVRARRRRVATAVECLRATPGLAHLTARSLAVTSYEPAAGCELTREAQKIAVEAAQERTHG